MLPQNGQDPTQANQPAAASHPAGQVPFEKHKSVEGG